MSQPEKEDGRHSNPGRPEKEINWKKVDDLLIAGSTGTEIASHFDMHPNTFYGKVQDRYKCGFTQYASEKKQLGDSLLRAHQFQKALGLTTKGDNTLLIWLGKNRLNQRDTQNDLPVTNETIAQFTDLMKQLDKLQLKEGHTLDSSENSTSKTESNEEKS